VDDASIRARIEALVDEEQTIRDRESDGTASDDDRRRLDELTVELDQLWDLLRQRRALREAGKNPDDAGMRPPDTVETYEQ
jgi:hypothetical protein